MNNKRIKTSVCSVCYVLIFLLFLSIFPGAAEAETNSASTNASPLAESISETPLNPDYIQWMENDCKGLAPSPQDLSYLSESYAQNGLQAHNLMAGNFPSHFDLRASNRVDGVVDQHTTGLCWSIAANSAAAGSIRDSHPQLSLSPVHTAWFCYRGQDEEEFTSVANPYYSGGNDGRAVATMAAWKGPVLSSHAPYNVRHLQPLDESLRYAADFHLQDAYYMPSGIYRDSSNNTHVSTEITKRMLMEVGPVTLSYRSHGTNAYNPKTYACYNSKSELPNHTVLIIGWDDNFSRDKFNTGNQPAHDGAWLVRNSWGPYWGNNGYFWISYEDRSLIQGNAYLLEEQNNYTHNYQYDLNGWAFSTGTGSKCATAANIFTAVGTEQLEAVSFYTTDANAHYDISIYTNVSAGNPQSGTCQLSSQQGYEAYAGYHTIELNKPVRLEKG